MLLVAPGERAGAQPFDEGVYSIDVSTPLSPEVQAFLPAIAPMHTCGPLGEAATRRMHSRITVAGSRAYLTTAGNVRVIDLE